MSPVTGGVDLDLFVYLFVFKCHETVMNLVETVTFLRDRCV